MKVLIFEDDIIWATKIKIICFEIGFKKVEIHENLNNFEYNISKIQPDLIIADIYLENKINILDNIFFRNTCKVPIIFVTSSEDYSNFSKAKKIDNTIFIVKPFHKLTLQSAVQNLLKKADSSNENYESCYVELKGSYNELIKLNCNQIIFLIQNKTYCSIHTKNEKYILRTSLTKLARRLDEHFIQINKSTIININYIENFFKIKSLIKIHQNDFTLSRSFRDNFLKKYIAR